MRTPALLIALLALACRTAPVEHAPAHFGSTGATLAGAKLFRYHCAQCHGEDAEGRGRVPALRSGRVADRSDAELFRFITNGDLRHGMPSWSQLTPDRRWQIVSFLRQMNVRSPLR